MKIPELLAPAGSYETLIAVCNAGADAVYAAGLKFGARAYAANFTDEALIKALKYLHLQGKKLYLTINTLLKNHEMKELYDYILPLYTEGLDAVIVQDMGVFSYIKEQFPDLSVHVSTQAAAMGKDSLDFYEDLQAKRVVLPRELSLHEIADLKQSTGLEIEVFTHGALCYSYSGMCLYSSLIGGRSGNRGRCAQPCRLECSINDRKKEFLSLKDLSALAILDKLCDAGIDSLKIEGRMKNAAYAAGVTSVYRKYLDRLKENPNPFTVAKEDIETLERLYQRRGFTTGYFFKHNGSDMLIGEKTAPREEINAGTYADFHEKKLPVALSAYFFKDKEALLKVIGQDGIIIEAKGDICERALNRPLTSEVIKEKLMKMGDTPLNPVSVEVKAEEGVFLPLSSVNALKRKAVSLYLAKLDEPFKREIPERVINLPDSAKRTKSSSTIRLSASVLTFTQCEALKSIEKVQRIYFPLELIVSDKRRAFALIKDLHDQKKQVYCALPAIFRSRIRDKFIALYTELDHIFDGFLLKNTDELYFMHRYHPEKKCIADFTVYRYNDWSCILYGRYCKEFTVPIELNRNELSKMDLTSSEMIIYGRYPMMFSANCLVKNSDTCRQRCDMIKLKDRKNMDHYVKAECFACYNTIYNAKVLSLLGCMGRVKRLKPASYRLMFTTESAVEVLHIINSFDTDAGVLQDPKDYTRGHFDRGVE